jgi:ABC-type transport system involved in cytochrome c biogenesis permease subunit
MNPLNAVLLMLATWYLSYAMTKTHGPFGAFNWLRVHVPAGGLTTCMVCLSLWTGLLFYLALVYLPVVVYPFAAAGGAILLHRYTGGDHT